MSAKVTYFHLTGLGEPVRLTLAAANVPFEDVRLNKEEFLKLKPTLQWGQLPMLEIDGKILFQSKSICRYIARRNGLAGSDDLEAAYIDSAVDALDDFRIKITSHYYSPDSPQREAALANCRENVLPFYLTRLEKQVEQNNGHLVNGKLSWADVIFVAFTDYFAGLLGVSFIDNYPHLKELREKVTQLEGVKRYLASRPEITTKDYRTLFNFDIKS